MDDREKRRLNRQFAVTWFLLLLTVLVVLFMAAQNPKIETHNFVGQQGLQGESIVGPIGPAGESIQGKAGRDGIDGKTTVVERQTTIFEPVKGERGDAGPQGEPGAAGPQLQIQVNPESRNLEYKYSSDTLWNVLIPCEQLIVGCEEQDGSAVQ